MKTANLKLIVENNSSHTKHEWKMILNENGIEINNENNELIENLSPIEILTRYSALINEGEEKSINLAFDHKNNTFLSSLDDNNIVLFRSYIQNIFKEHHVAWLQSFKSNSKSSNLRNLCYFIFIIIGILSGYKIPLVISKILSNNLSFYLISISLLIMGSMLNIMMLLEILNIKFPLLKLFKLDGENSGRNYTIFYSIVLLGTGIAIGSILTLYKQMV